MKTKEELNAIKEEVENLNKKLRELTEDELKQVTGGLIPNLPRAASNGRALGAFVGGAGTFVVPGKDKGNGVEKEIHVYTGKVEDNFT